MPMLPVQPIGAGSSNSDNPYSQSARQDSKEEHNHAHQDANEIGIQCMLSFGDAILPSLADTDAAKIFDKKDIAPRGIMQPETIIFNENDASIKAPNVILPSRTKPVSGSVVEMESPYREALAGILLFSTLSEAEATIKRLESLRQKYQSAGDNRGVECCRKIALLGRHRAQLISRNRKVRLEKRRQKREIAAWFGIWLETPEIFENWLVLRKKTEEFQEIIKNEN